MSTEPTLPATQVGSNAIPDGARTTPAVDKDKVKAHFEHYWEYAKLWRTWVVGTAVAALYILTSKDVGGTFHDRARIAKLFVIAAASQILLAWINKIAAYYEYRYQDGDRGRWIDRWRKINGRYGIDIVCDLISLFFVGWAVCAMINNSLLGPVATQTGGGP